MPRNLFRLITAATTSVVLLVLTALPALAAAAGTKPDPDKNPFLIGTMEQLVPTAIVGVVVAILAFVLMPSSDAAEDEHH